MRKVFVLALLAGVLVPGTAQAHSTYCSPTGDYCTGVVNGKRGIALRISTFSFSGRYRLCVRGPDGKANCGRFSLMKTKRGIFQSTKGWRKNFPDRGRGTYRVRWQKFGRNLGPALMFTR